MKILNLLIPLDLSLGFFFNRLFGCGSSRRRRGEGSSAEQLTVSFTTPARKSQSTPQGEKYRPTEGRRIAAPVVAAVVKTPTSPKIGHGLS